MNLKYYQKIINQNLRKFFNGLKFSESKNPLIKEQLKLLKNFCLLPGKRLRPILAIAAFKAVSYHSTGSGQASFLKDIFLSVLSLELYHNYTLIHDDIYDEDIVRREKPTCHFLLQKWFKEKYKKIPYSGNLYKNSWSRFGVVSGFIDGKILRALVTLPIFQSNISLRKKIEILKLFEELDISDNFGQAADLFFEKENKITQDDYFEMVKLKTGGLFKASVELGAILGGATLSQKKALKNYAENLAYVFQIKDDLLDLSIGGEKGRGVGSDIKKGKKTLLLISSLKKAGLKDRKLIFRIIGKEDASVKEIETIIKLYHRLGAVEFCQNTAKQKIEKTLLWLNKLKLEANQESYRFLKELIFFVFERKK